jgi:hypothetical protein
MAVGDILTYLAHVPTVTLAIAAGCVCLALLLLKFYSWYRLSHVPGPFWNSITGWAMVMKLSKGHWIDEIEKMARAYGLSFYNRTMTINS